MNPQAARTQWQRAVAALAALGMCLGLAGATLLTGPASATEPDPTLSISIDNGQTSAEAGDELDYTISVENLGTERVRDLRVTQTMPPGLTFGSADRDGAAGKDMVVWSVDLKPTSTLTLHTTMRVGVTPDEVLRMATVACAALTAKKAPIVCATHSDLLPAGARAAEAADKASDASNDNQSEERPALVWVGLGALLLVLAGAALVAVRRKRA